VGSVRQLGNWDVSNAVCLGVRISKAKIIENCRPHVDSVVHGPLPRMGRNSVLTPQNTIAEQVHPQRAQRQRMSLFSSLRSTVMTNALHGQIVWESDPYREHTTPASGVQSIVENWR
jgi:hypothetical protein